MRLARNAFCPLLGECREVHGDAQCGHGHAKHDVGEIDQLRGDGGDERHERADDRRPDEAEHEPRE